MLPELRRREIRQGAEHKDCGSLSKEGDSAWISLS